MPAARRDDLAELLRRRALTEDAARPDAVERRHAAGGRTARENVADLVDPGSFVEYGRFAIAAQRQRRDARGPDRAHAGRRPGRGHRARRTASAVRACSPTTTRCSPARRARSGHRKKDRLFELIERMRLPTVFFAEGGGGRPGDTDYPVGLGARRARVRAVGAAVGARAADRDRQGPLLRRQRGDRRLLGPDRRHRGRLDRHGRPGDDRRRRARRRRRPTRSARSTMQAPNGVVDVVVADEAEAVAVDQAPARLLPGRGARPARARPDARCATLVPERERRAYTVAPDHRDAGRRGLGDVPARALRARDGDRAGPHRGPAGRRHRQQHDGRWPARSRAAASDKAARFLQLCDAFGLPVVSLVDMPGLHGRARGRGRGAGAPRLAHARRRRRAARAARRGDAAPRLRPRRAGDGRRQPARAAAHRRVAERPPRPDGPRGRRAARRCARSSRRSPTTTSASSACASVTAAAQENAKALNAAAAVRDRRRHRPRRDARPDRRDARRRRRAPGGRRTRHRFVDTW